MLGRRATLLVARRRLSDGSWSATRQSVGDISMKKKGLPVRNGNCLKQQKVWQARKTYSHVLHVCHVAFANRLEPRAFSTYQGGENRNEASDSTNAMEHSALYDKIESKSSSEPEEDLLQETSRLIQFFDESAVNEEGGNLLSHTRFEDVDRLVEAWANKAAESTKLKNGMEAAEKAESLLVALEQNMDSDRDVGNQLIPDAALYNRVLHAYAVCRGGQEAADHAQSILERMMSRCRDYVKDPNGVKPPEPTSRSFNIVINAWAKSRERDAGTHAEEVFTMMEDWVHECQEQHQPTYLGEAPNARSLSGVVDAWAQTESSYAAERAMVILEHVIEKQRQHVLSEQGSGPAVEGTVIKPTVVVFNSAIHAWVNSGQGTYGAEKAGKILELQERLDETKELGEVDSNDDDDVGLTPTTTTLSLILDAWAQCEDSSGKAAMRAQDLLDRMESLYHEGHNVKPNYVSFTTCITAWSRSRNVPDAAERAEALLIRLLNLYRSTGDEELKPTSVTGNAVITAWARSKQHNSAHRAKSVLEKLKAFSQPDSYSYNAVIDAYAKKGDARSAKRVLERMELAYKNGEDEVRPDVVTYNSVLNAMSRSRRKRGEMAIRAEELIGKMEALHRSGRTDVQPNLRSYTSAINCWANSQDPWQGVRAYKVLKRMIAQYSAGIENAKPDAFAFGRVIHACASTDWKSQKQRRVTLTTALRAFEELQQFPEYGDPHPRTYGALMMACARLAGDFKECERLLEAVFKQCCASGQVNRAILTQARRTMPYGLREYLLGPPGEQIPSGWSRNVPERQRP